MAQPIVAFKQLLPGLPPRRASRSAEGTLPARAMRWCQPISEASGFGWYLCLPMDFAIVFKNPHEALWTWEGQGDDWYPLDRAQFPGFSETFNAAAPSSEFHDYAPSFLTLGEDPGMLQVWTGAFVRTAPGWSLEVRAPANLDHSHGYYVYEGLIETDIWWGPLFTNIRLHDVDRPIFFKKRWPFLQVRAIPRVIYGERVLASFTVETGIENFDGRDWADFHSNIVAPDKCPHKQVGAYAIAARKRRAEEDR